ncbi:hypothetical protein [Tautonia marina]|uniref:hypothetical protein n=1 Tax=Tautonia marina TaxID=2653855 RepID=UPI001260A847|nr:hypothetical protein [Tautonia marina]
MANSRNSKVELLEGGDIFFLYRPDVEERDPEGLDDIQRFIMVLHPRRARRYRLITLGRKRMPELENGGSRHWAFVSKVCANRDEAHEEFASETYKTKTRGTRHQPAARPAGEGVYAIVRHGDHTHLAYALELPETPGTVQKELNIEPQASYILSVKNPEASSPKGVGLSESQQAEFPKSLQERFDGRRFLAVDPPNFLNHEGAELMLIGAHDDVAEELGIDLDPQQEDVDQAEILRELKLHRSPKMLKPLVEGQWT